MKTNTKMNTMKSVGTAFSTAVSTAVAMALTLTGCQSTPDDAFKDYTVNNVSISEMMANENICEEQSVELFKTNTGKYIKYSCIDKDMGLLPEIAKKYSMDDGNYLNGIYGKGLEYVEYSTYFSYKENKDGEFEFTIEEENMDLLYSDGEGSRINSAVDYLEKSTMADIFNGIDPLNALPKNRNISEDIVVSALMQFYINKI